MGRSGERLVTHPLSERKTILRRLRTLSEVICLTAEQDADELLPGLPRGRYGSLEERAGVAARRTDRPAGLALRV